MPVAIFDMDGVLYRGNIVMPYAKEALTRLRAAGWQVFFATNNSTATRAYPVEGRLLPGAGTIVAAIEVATGEKAICVGKPEPFLFEEALRRAARDGSGGAAKPFVVVGDSTDYDMVAAHRVGATGVLIL